jgi:RND family efflux transporter MFP subunit
MKRIFSIIILMICLTGCGNDGLGGDDSSDQSVPGSGLVEKAEASIPDVEPSAVQPPGSKEIFVARSAARRSVLTGFTRARNSMTLVSEESGRVQSVNADVGDTLGQDGVFARLDTTFIKLDLATNRTDQQRLKSDLDYSRKEMERYQALVKTKTAAQSTLDSNVRAHQSALQQLRAKQVEERVLMERLKRFTLTGPTGWKVVTRYIEPGEWITTGEKVAELGRFDVLLVPFALSSQEYGALKEMGETVPLRLADMGKTIQAKVARVSPGFDEETRKINVDLEISQGDFQFRGGLRTELTIDLPDPGGAVVVPRSALIKAYEEHFLMTPDGKRVRVVLLGIADNDMRRVTAEDVHPGDTFLLKP